MVYQDAILAHLEPYGGAGLWLFIFCTARKSYVFSNVYNTGLAPLCSMQYITVYHENVYPLNWHSLLSITYVSIIQSHKACDVIIMITTIGGQSEKQ